MRFVTGLAVLAVVAGLAGCSDGESGAAPDSSENRASSPSPSEVSVSPSEAAVVETPLEGTWGLEQTKQDVVSGLEAAGFGDLVTQFLRKEGIRAKDIWEWQFAGDRFTTIWQDPDGSDHAADWGGLEVRGDRAYLASEDSGHTCAFRWAIKGDELRLTFVKCTAETLRGLPEAAYWAAYLHQPLTRKP
jgi:hypothetical protein